MDKKQNKNKYNPGKPGIKKNKNKNKNMNNQKPGAIKSYICEVPVSRTTIIKHSNASIKNVGHNSVLVKHKELLANAVGQISFSSQFFSMQPGLATTFPWLSRMALLYEKYKVKKLSVRYITRATTSYPGSYQMAFDYDPLDGLPNGEAAFSSYSGLVETPPWRDVVLHMDPKMCNREYYIRSSPLVAGSADLKTYDVANLIVASVDGTSGAQWGKIWLEYEIELINPQASIFIPTVSQFTFTSAWTSGITGSSIFGTVPNVTVPTANSTGYFTAGTGANNNQLIINGLTIGHTINVQVVVIGTGLSYFNAGISYSGGTIGSTATTSMSNSPGTTSLFDANFTATAASLVILFPAQSATTVSYAGVLVSDIGTTYVY